MFVHIGDDGLFAGGAQSGPLRLVSASARRSEAVDDRWPCECQV